MTDRFWLILVAWGDRYGVEYINHLAKTTLKLSKMCDRVVLITDRERPGVDPRVVQETFPEGFRRPELFKGGYPAKLALFTCPGAPSDMRCVYVDLDTIMVGDIGRIAADLRQPNEFLMLKAGSVGFNALSRLVNRLSQGERYSTGNSSVLAFTAGEGRRLAERFLASHSDIATHSAKHMKVDDAFISWFAAQDLRAIRTDHAVMFRREFLSRVPGLARLKGRLPWVRRRRQNLVAITFNGAEYKPSVILELSEGDPIYDRKGRKGYWSQADMGPLQDKIVAYCEQIVQS